MHSPLFHLCLIAVYAVASASAASPHMQAVHLRKVRSMRPFGTAVSLRERAMPTLLLDRAMAVDPCDEDEDDETSTLVTSTQRYTRTIVQAATQTRTKTVTRVTGTSTKVMTYTQTLTRTATATRTAAATTQPVTTISVTVTSTSTSTQPIPSSAPAPATTTLYSLVTPIPTSTNIVFEGVATYYYTGLGACGWWSNDSDMVVALQDKVFDNYPGASSSIWPNPVCGHKIQVNYNGNSVIATVVDRCAGCELYHADLSPSAFAQLAPLEVGYLTEGLTWSWID